MKARNLFNLSVCFVVLLGMVVVVHAETQGVSKDEIVVGTHTALSGPVAGWGIDATNGIRMRFDEANADGGIHGRSINYIVEDSQYRVPIAVQKANKLVNRDKVFFLILCMRTRRPGKRRRFSKTITIDLARCLPKLPNTDIFVRILRLWLYKKQARNSLWKIFSKPLKVSKDINIRLGDPLSVSDRKSTLGQTNLYFYRSKMGNGLIHPVKSRFWITDNLYIHRYPNIL